MADRALRARVAPVLVGALAALPAAAAEREEPLWEAGVGLAGLHFPDYRGSSQSRNYLLPVPYFVYRGNRLRADRQGVRRILFDNERIVLNMSVGASLPVSSDKNRAREGMPDLKPSLELGPTVEVNLWESGDERTRLELRTPLRGAISVERDPRYVGTQFFPHLNIDVHDFAGFRGLDFGALAGPVFTDKRYNRHYYAVEERFATAARPAYEPRGGYAGMEFIVGVSKRFPKYWIGAFARYDTLRGARFEDSPLVTSKRYVAGGIGISWILGQSQKTVPVNRYGDPLR